MSAQIGTGLTWAKFIITIINVKKKTKIKPLGSSHQI